MFNLGGGELALILVVALLVLGPKRLPELARGIGKFVREFRRQTDSVRNVVEREFYKMDQDVTAEEAPKIAPPQGSVAQGSDALPAGDAQPSQLTAPMDETPIDESDPRHPDYNREQASDLHAGETPDFHHPPEAPPASAGSVPAAAPEGSTPKPEALQPGASDKAKVG